MPHQPDYLAPYHEAILQHGPGFDATLWSSREGQQLRFDVAMDLVGFDRHSVLDVGCGVGDLALHMIERGVPFTRYTGLDALDGMIEAAGAIDDSRCSFEVLDVVRHQDRLAGYKADVIIVSGTLNAMEESMARELMGSAFEACSTALVFNFLSDQAHGDWLKRDLAPARRFDTVGWLGWALGRTSLVRFTQSYYGGHDATIAMFHEDPGAEGTG